MTADAIYIGLFYLLDIKENQNSPDTSGHLAAVGIIVKFLEPLTQYHIIASRGLKLLHRLLSPLATPLSVITPSNEFRTSTPTDLNHLDEQMQLHPSGSTDIREVETEEEQVDVMAPWMMLENDMFYDPFWEGMNEASGEMFADEEWFVDNSVRYM